MNPSVSFLVTQYYIKPLEVCFTLVSLVVGSDRGVLFSLTAVLVKKGVYIYFMRLIVGSYLIAFCSAVL